MKFGRKLQAIYFACIGFIQVVTGFDITINGSQPYYVVGRPFMFTCTFDSTAVAVRILQKNNVKVQSVQLSGADCYNVQIAPAVICDPTFCSCSQQGNTFTASWNFTVSDTQTNTWKCVEGSSQSPDFHVKPAVSCNTVTLTKEQDISYVGQDIKLSCVTDGCRPRAHIQWYIGNKNSTENATATVTTTNSTEELVRVESKLTLTAAIDLNEQTVSCVAWNFDPSVYVMANGTLNVTSQTTTELVTTSTELLTTHPETISADSVTTTTKSETTTKSFTGSTVTEGDLTTNKPTTTPVADGSSVMTTVENNSNKKLSGLYRDEIIAIVSIVGFFIINTKDERENQELYLKHQGQMNRHAFRYDDYNTRSNLYDEGYDIKQERGERYRAQGGDPNQRQKMTTTRSYTTYQQPRGHDYNHYKSTKTVSTYYPRMYGESHNYGFDMEMSPYIQSFQYYTGNTQSSYNNHQNPERSGGRHHGRYQGRQDQSYPVTSNYYYPNGQYYYEYQ